MRRSFRSISSPQRHRDTEKKSKNRRERRVEPGRETDNCRHPALGGVRCLSSSLCLCVSVVHYLGQAVAPRREKGMKQLTIVVKPFRAEAVLRAIADLDVTSCVVREAKGYSRQKGYLDRYLGSEYSMAFLPKVEISVCVSDERYEEVADRIVKAA